MWTQRCETGFKTHCANESIYQTPWYSLRSIHSSKSSRNSMTTGFCRKYSHHKVSSTKQRGSKHLSCLPRGSQPPVRSSADAFHSFKPPCHSCNQITHAELAGRGSAACFFVSASILLCSVPTQPDTTSCSLIQSQSKCLLPLLRHKGSLKPQSERNIFTDAGNVVKWECGVYSVWQFSSLNI